MHTYEVAVSKNSYLMTLYFVLERTTTTHLVQNGTEMHVTIIRICSFLNGKVRNYHEPSLQF